MNVPPIPATILDVSYDNKAQLIDQIQADLNYTSSCLFSLWYTYQELFQKLKNSQFKDLNNQYHANLKQVYGHYVQQSSLNVFDLATYSETDVRVTISHYRVVDPEALADRGRS